MYVMRLSTMTMQLPLAQMSNRDGEAGMETMLWDISVIPNEQDKRFFFNRWLHRISRILAVLGYEGIKNATPVMNRTRDTLCFLREFYI